MAAWAKTTVDGCSNLVGNDAVTADIRLELCTSGGEVAVGEDLVPPPPDKLPAHVYHPRNALKSAISDWIVEFGKVRSVWGPISKPQVGLNPTSILQPSINTCMTATTTTSSINSLLPTASTSASSVSPKPALGPESTSSSNISPNEQLNNLVTTVNTSVLGPGTTPLVPVMNSLVSNHEVLVERPGQIVSPTVETKTVLQEPMETNLEPEGKEMVL